MSNGALVPWNDRQQKHDAILRVMRHIIKNPAAGAQCVGRGRPPFQQDVAAHTLFEDPTIGNIQIPADSRVVFFASGEEALEVGSSLIIELPPTPLVRPLNSPDPSDRELLSYVLGNYVHW